MSTTTHIQPSLIVIKIGGQVIDNETSLLQFLSRCATLKQPWLLVHGGGKIASTIGTSMGLVPQYHEGRRITDEPTRNLVTMVYGGLINKQIVARLQQLNCNAIGLSGADANTIPAVIRPATPIDFGFVGDVDADKINVSMLRLLINHGLLPVVAPLTHDGNGNLLNTNADTIASSLAIALSRDYKVKLIYCFEKKGVLTNVDDPLSIIPIIKPEEKNELISAGKISGGMIPKIENAIAAIQQGVDEIIIGDAEDLSANVSEHPVGTLIRG